MAVVKPCPICKKMPKISQENYIFTIQCKPIFQIPHLIVQVCNNYLYDGHIEVVKEWNKKVDEYEGEQYGTEGENH